MRWQYNPDCLIAYYCNIWGIWLDTSILHFDIPLDSLELICMMSLFSQSLVSLQESTFSCVAVTLLYCLFWVTSCVANLSFLKYFRQIWDAVVIFDFLLLIGLCFFCNFWVHVNDRKSSKCPSWSSITITWQQRPHFPMRHSQNHFWGTLPTNRKVAVRVTSDKKLIFKMLDLT